ncbi:MAG: AAA family ATPase [Gemmatimonadales bacterium]
MNRAAAVCGRICSGKSTLTRDLASSYGWSIVSFGSYIRQVAEHDSLPPTREHLQSIGESLLTHLGPDGLLSRVLEAQRPSGTVHLIDGVRHVSVLRSVEKTYSTLVIFLDPPGDTRFKRFLAREGLGDGAASHLLFEEINNHAIENGVEGLKPHADLVLEGELSRREALEIVVRLLRRHHYLPE